jgi:septal ring factor EnvC (AmiA/AmiB activator)
MIRSVSIRRSLTIVGVALSLVVGFATIRAAAAWTASAAPLTDAPPSVAQLEEALAQEQARSATLSAQIDQLTSTSADLENALKTARDRIATDATQADDMRAALAAAKDRLAKLEAAIRAARTATVNTVVVAAPRAAGQSAQHEDDEDEHESDD